ncbi:MAG: TPR end-of-group domain-containing protein, partial [Gemmatimonadales bacterium]
PNPQSVALRHFGAPVPSVRVVRPAVPDWMDRALQRALAKAPADRFASVRAFADALIRPPAEEEQALRSIAVLPFLNLSPDPDSEYFSDGITEEIITALARVPALQVAARTSSFAFKGRTDDVRRIGKQLGVAAVLEGSIRRAGGRLRVTAQLISVADGYHLWSERFDRDLADVFAIQDEIAGKIAEALVGLLGRAAEPKEAAERVAPRDLEAYDLYLRGRELMHQFRRKQFQRARELFRAAVEREPAFALAWAGIAQASSHLYTTFDASIENSAEADASSRRAVELAPELVETRTARGYALAINRRLDEAWPHFEAAFRIGPRDFDAWFLAGRAAVLAGDHRRAAGYFERAAEVRPEDYQSCGLGGMAFEGMGERAEAARLLRLAADRAQRWLDLYPNDVRALYLGGIALARLGETAEARAKLERAASMDPDDPATVYNIACGLAVLGEVERAIDCLERCYRMGFAHHDWIRNDPDLNALRSHPRFQALLGSA